MERLDDSEFLDALLELALQEIESGRQPDIAVLTADRPHLVSEARGLVRTLRDVAVIGGDGAPALPGFTIVGEAGRGGMGRVYLASQDRLGGRPVALKVWRRASVGAGEGPVEQLRGEASTLARVRHPGVVTVHDVLAHEGSVAIAMEWVDGATLAGVIDAVAGLGGAHRTGMAGLNAVTALLARGGAAPAFADAGYTAWVSRVGAQVARALGAAHRAGVLHRDVKPSNILLRRDGTPLLSDFGLATLEQLDAPGSGRFAGTLAYAAPEQVGGDKVGPGSDVYALGATLYHALALRGPHHIDETSSLEGPRARRAAPRLRSVDPRIPPDLEAIVEKAMAERPGDRYADADELADDLERLLRLEPVHARPTSASYVARKFVVRNRLGVGAAGAVIVALAAGLAVALVALQNAVDSKTRADVSAAENRTSAYVASIQAAWAEIRGDDTIPAAGQLASAPVELRGWEWRYLQGQLDRTLGPLFALRARDPGVNATARGLVIDPGGRWLAVYDGDGRIAIVDMPAPGYGPVADGATRILDLREAMGFEPNGLHADGSSGLLIVGEALGPRVLFVDPATLGIVRSFSLGPEHSHVHATTSARGDLLAVWAWEKSGSVLQVRAAGTDEVLGQWSRERIDRVGFVGDGEQLVLKADSSAELFDWRSGQGTPLEARVDGMGQSRDDLAISADGSRFALANQWLTQVWSSDRPTPIATLAARSLFKGQRAAFSPDGQRLYCYEGRLMRAWEVGTSNQVLAARTVYPSRFGASPGVSHDGRFLYTGHDDGAIRAWSTDTREDPLVFPCPQGGAISPDFLLVACRAYGPGEGSDPRRVLIKAAATGEVVQDFVMGSTEAQRVHRTFAFSPDGKWLVRSMHDGEHSDQSVCVREIATGTTYERTLVPALATESVVTTSCFLSGPDRLVVPTDQGLEVLSVPGLETLEVLRTGAPVRSTSSARDSSRFAVTLNMPDGSFTVQIRDGRSCRVLREFRREATGGRFLPALLSPDGAFFVLATVGDAEPDPSLLELCDSASGERLAAWTGDGLIGLAFDPSGTRLALGLKDGTVRVVALVPMPPDQKPVLREVLSLRGDSWMNRPFFSDDGTRLGCVTVYPSNRCIIWDARAESERLADREGVPALTFPRR